MDLMTKLETIVRAYAPNATIVSPNAEELFLAKWGPFRVNPETLKVQDPTLAVLVQMGTSKRQTTLLVDMEQEVVVGAQG